MLTFDNGYQSQYTNALPVLRRLGWEGVENLQLTGLPPSQGGLSPDAGRAASSPPGGSSTRRASATPTCTTLDAAELHYQVAQSPAATVQRLYHVPVNWFCYPSGHYNAAVIAAVQAAGYRGSTTVVPGWAQPGRGPLPAAAAARARRHQRGRSCSAEIAGDPRRAPPPASYETSRRHARLTIDRMPRMVTRHRIRHGASEATMSSSPAGARGPSTRS